MAVSRNEMIPPGDLTAAVDKAVAAPTKRGDWTDAGWQEALRGNWIDTGWQEASNSYAYASGRCPVCGGEEWQERRIGKPSSHLDVFGRCSGCGHGIHNVQVPVWDRSWD